MVGDDDQSIYGWRGAEVAHILRFKNDWPEAKVVRLEVNYRSTREIVEWANRLIAFNKLRHGKVLRATFSGEPPRILQLEDEVEGGENGRRRDRRANRREEDDAPRISPSSAARTSSRGRSRWSCGGRKSPTC